MMGYKLIEQTEEINGTATVITYVPNACNYNELSLKSVTFLDSNENAIEPTTGSVQSFVIHDSENISGTTDNVPWTNDWAVPWYDTITVAQLRSNQGHYFSYQSPPDFIGFTFTGVNSEVKKVRVRWYAFK